MAYKRAPVDRERLEQPVGMGVEARQEGRKHEGCFPIAVGRQRRGEAVPYVMRQAVRPLGLSQSFGVFGSLGMRTA